MINEYEESTVLKKLLIEKDYKKAAEVITRINVEFEGELKFCVLCEGINKPPEALGGFTNFTLCVTNGSESIRFLIRLDDGKIRESSDLFKYFQSKIKIIVKELRESHKDLQ